MLQGSIEAGRQGDDCAFAAQADEIPAIGAEIATAGIQAFKAASIANDAPMGGSSFSGYRDVRPVGHSLQ